MSAVDVLGQHDTILHFPELISVDHRDRVFLRVDHALLEARVDLYPDHWHRVRAQSREGIHVDLVLHRPQSNTLEIVRLGDLPIDRQVAPAVLPDGEAGDALGIEIFQQGLTDLSVEHGVSVLAVTEEERHVENVDLGREASERPRRHHGHVDCAKLQSLDHLALFAKLAVR